MVERQGKNREEDHWGSRCRSQAWGGGDLGWGGLWTRMHFWVDCKFPVHCNNNLDSKKFCLLGVPLWAVVSKSLVHCHLIMRDTCMKTCEKHYHRETIVLGQISSPLGKERQGYFQTLYFIPLIGLFWCQCYTVFTSYGMVIGFSVWWE